MTDRWCLNSGQMSTANKATPVRKEDAFFLFYKVLSGVLGSTPKWRGTGRKGLWKKPLSPKYPLTVLGLPYSSENKNSSWRYGVEKRSWPTRRFKFCTHTGYILHISYWHWTNQDHASYGRRKRMYRQETTVMVNLKQFLSTAMATRHCCTSRLKCVKSLNNHKKRYEKGCNKYHCCIIFLCWDVID